MTLNSTVKCFVIMANMLFLVAGAGLTALGVYVKQSEYVELDPDLVGSAADYVMGVGVALFLFAVIGLVGACKQHRFFLCVYMGLLCALIAAQAYATMTIFREVDSLEDARDGGSIGYDDTEEELRENFNTLYEAAFNSTLGEETGQYGWLLDFVDDHCEVNSTAVVLNIESPYDQCRVATLNLMLKYTVPLGYAVVSTCGFQVLLLLFSCLLCCYHKSETPQERLAAQRDALFGGGFEGNQRL